MKLLSACIAIGLLAAVSCSAGVEAPALEQTEALRQGSPVPTVSAAPSLPGRGVDGWTTGGDSEILDTSWERLHIPVNHGSNEIDLSLYMDSSTEVEFGQACIAWDPATQHSSYGEALKLNTPASGLSFAQFGLREFAPGDGLRSIYLEGRGSVYVGVGNYDSGAFQWYGPYDSYGGPDDAIQIDLPPFETVNGDGKAYFVLGASPGWFVASKLVVRVGQTTSVTQVY